MAERQPRKGLPTIKRGKFTKPIAADVHCNALTTAALAGGARRDCGAAQSHVGERRQRLRKLPAEVLEELPQALRDACIRSRQLTLGDAIAAPGPAEHRPGHPRRSYRAVTIDPLFRVSAGLHRSGEPARRCHEPARAAAEPAGSMGRCRPRPSPARFAGPAPRAVVSVMLTSLHCPHQAQGGVSANCRPQDPAAACRA
jgi:hypothetical protein